MIHSSVPAERTRLLDLLWQIQDAKGFIGEADITQLARQLDVSEVDIQGVISFYHFFHVRPTGRFVIYLNNSVTSMHSGYKEVLSAFEKTTGAHLGETDPTGTFSLFETSCIGLSDLEPAALINFHPFTQLTPIKVGAIIRNLQKGIPVEDLSDPIPDNIRHLPPPGRRVLLRDHTMGQSLEKLRHRTAEEALVEIEESGLRGMGGAFFPVGKKWRLCRQQSNTPKYLICNADEGEPGTFKDRLLLKTFPGLVIEGMILGAYCTGASEGIIYLRAEYRWLLPGLKETLARYREAGWLGADIPAREPFDFDIRIQLGAGAYVCGEETALLNSLEGYRGEPRVRTFYPVERGFMGQPTVVNNVESFAAAARVTELGAAAFRSLGAGSIPGTRLVSVSGDCRFPGIYEIEWGTSLGELLDYCEAKEAFFVQVSGPSGQCVSAFRPERRFELDDLRCGGAVTIFNRNRDLLETLRNFNLFFKHESCGVCTPCRAGNYIFCRKLKKMALGMATPTDRENIIDWSRLMRQTCRCGLGRSANNALLSAMEEFEDYFKEVFEQGAGGHHNRSFDLEAATLEYRRIVNPKLI